MARKFHNILLSTAGNSTVQNPKFIVMISAGFTATTDSFKFTYGSYDGTAKVEEVDGKGPNGEQLFEVTLSGATPNFTTAQVTGSITLTPNFTGENGGSHTYSNSTAPLISELSTDGQAGRGTYTFTTNAGPINVVQNNQTVNWLNAGTTGANSGVSATYIIQVGKEKLATDAYSISNIKATPHEGKTSNDAGYEQLSFTFTPKGELKDEQYFDVHLGLPNQNGIELYDKTLGDNLPIYAKDGTQVGTAYKMGTYYRVVFNSNAEKVTTGNNHPSWTLNLNWGNPQSQQPSISTNQSSSNTTDLGKVYVYQYTDDQSKNGMGFAYTPTNDVNINGQTFASGLHIQGEYVYSKQYLEYNKKTMPEITFPYNRTWSPNNGVVTNADWYNNIGFQIATSGATKSQQNTSNNFDLTITVGKSDQFNYNWASDADLEKQIKNNFAWYVNNELSNEVTGTTSDQVYLKNEVKKDTQTTSDVVVTHEDVTTTDGTLKRIYHVQISDPNVRLGSVPGTSQSGIIFPLSVTAKSAFTMPTDIKSYQEDLNAAATVDKDNYANYPQYGLKTSNEALQNALINTQHPTMVIKNNTSNEVVPEPSNFYYNTWKSSIGYNNNRGVNNSADASNYRTATLEFYNDKDPANPVLIDGTTIDYQGASDTPIDFANATSTLADLISKGYTLEKVEDPNGNVMTSGPDGKLALSDYPYGNLINSSNIFKVYLHYTDVQSISTSQSVSTSISNSYSIQRSESRSESLSISEARSGSISRSLSNSISQSESTSRSLSQSESASDLESTSIASQIMSESIYENSDSNNSSSESITQNISIPSTVSHNTLTPSTKPSESIFGKNGKQRRSQTQNVPTKKMNVKGTRQRRLPQTGTSEGSTPLLGAIAATIGGLLGFRRNKKRRKE